MLSRELSGVDKIDIPSKQEMSEKEYKLDLHKFNNLSDIDATTVGLLLQFFGDDESIYMSIISEALHTAISNNLISVMRNLLISVPAHSEIAYYQKLDHLYALTNDLSLIKSFFYLYAIYHNTKVRLEKRSAADPYATAIVINSHYFFFSHLAEPNKTSKFKNIDSIKFKMKIQEFISECIKITMTKISDNVLPFKENKIVIDITWRYFIDAFPLPGEKPHSNEFSEQFAYLMNLYACGKEADFICELNDMLPIYSKDYQSYLLAFYGAKQITEGTLNIAAITLLNTIQLAKENDLCLAFIAHMLLISVGNNKHAVEAMLMPELQNNSLFNKLFFSEAALLNTCFSLDDLCRIQPKWNVTADTSLMILFAYNADPDLFYNFLCRNMALLKNIPLHLFRDLHTEGELENYSFVHGICARNNKKVFNLLLQDCQLAVKIDYNILYAVIKSGKYKNTSIFQLNSTIENDESFLIKLYSLHPLWIDIMPSLTLFSTYQDENNTLSAFYNLTTTIHGVMLLTRVFTAHLDNLLQIEYIANADSYSRAVETFRKNSPYNSFLIIYSQETTRWVAYYKQEFKHTLVEIIINKDILSHQDYLDALSKINNESKIDDEIKRCVRKLLKSNYLFENYESDNLCDNLSAEVLFAKGYVNSDGVKRSAFYNLCQFEYGQQLLVMIFKENPLFIEHVDLNDMFDIYAFSPASSCCLFDQLSQCPTGQDLLALLIQYNLKLANFVENRIPPNELSFISDTALYEINLFGEFIQSESMDEVKAENPGHNIDIRIATVMNEEKDISAMQRDQFDLKPIHCQDIEFCDDLFLCNGNFYNPSIAIIVNEPIELSGRLKICNVGLIGDTDLINAYFLAVFPVISSDDNIRFFKNENINNKFIYNNTIYIFKLDPNSFKSIHVHLYFGDWHALRERVYFDINLIYKTHRSAKCFSLEYEFNRQNIKEINFPISVDSANKFISRSKSQSLAYAENLIQKLAQEQLNLLNIIEYKSAKENEVESKCLIM